MLKSFLRLWLGGMILCGIAKAQPWVMFNDLDDTYLYDQASGQVYIRIKKGGKNYEDTFVRMGVQDSIASKPNTKAQKISQAPKDSQPIESQNDAQKEQQELIKKAQELQRSIQGSIFGGE